MKKNEKRVTKKAIFASLLSLALCTSMLIGTSFAWFTDSAVSSGNVIQSGTLDVEVNWANGTTDPTAVAGNQWLNAESGAIFNYELWEPGFVQARHIQIANKGNLALKYQFAIQANGELQPNDYGHTLADAIDVYYGDPAVQVENRQAFAEAVAEGKLTLMGTLTDALAGLATTGNGVLYPEDNDEGRSSSDTVTIVLKMREGVGNEYQNMSLGSSFSVQVLATQYTYEEDAFDDQYDADADGKPDNAVFPVIATASTQEFINALNNAKDGDEIVLPKDTPITGLNLYTQKQITIDLNDQKLQNINVYGGDITFENGSLSYEGGQALYVNPYDENTNVHVTVAKDVTIEGDYGITLWPGFNSETKTGNSVVDMYGTVNGNIFVSGNLYAGASVVNVYGTVNSDDIGIAVNGYATVNIKSGATVKGETGVEVRAGGLNVEAGAYIEGTGTPTVVTPNGNGTTTTGAGIAVAQHTTKLPINVNISGGTIKGYSALYVSNPQNNDAASLNKINVNVTGGDFSTINGGTVTFFVQDGLETQIHYSNVYAN